MLTWWLPRCRFGTAIGTYLLLFEPCFLMMWILYKQPPIFIYTFSHNVVASIESSGETPSMLRLVQAFLVASVMEIFKRVCFFAEPGFLVVLSCMCVLYQK